MTRRPTRRRVERAIERLEDQDRAETLEERDREHKVYRGVSLDRLPMPESARETAEEWPGTAHGLAAGADGEPLLSGARVIGWSRDGEDRENE